ncbi:uncharacterized protein [Nicotiana sylvestris]|uniref:uncharacterized protein n=1 Tax=Nicotiana sylvestris TaxID=4096 RepID=UPI00388C648E
MTEDYIREEVREVLGVLKGYSGGHQGDWWWNDVVQGKVEAKKVAYIKLVESISEDQRRANRERYKETRKEGKLAVTEANTDVFGRLYEELRGKRYQVTKSYHESLGEGGGREDKEGGVYIGKPAQVHAGSFYYGSYPPYQEVGRIIQGRKRDLHMVFVDLEKAYDKVPKDVLWRCLEVKGMPMAYIRVIKDMYDGAITRDRIVRGDSEPFSEVMGLHQGFALNPFLFALAMDALTHHIQGEVPWCILFADDIVLIDET